MVRSTNEKERKEGYAGNNFYMYYVSYAWHEKISTNRAYKGSSAIKNVRVPKGLENHKKLLTEPWQLSDANWRTNILMPTIGSAVQAACGHL